MNSEESKKGDPAIIPDHEILAALVEENYKKKWKLDRVRVDVRSSNPLVRLLNGRNTYTFIISGFGPDGERTAELREDPEKFVRELRQTEPERVNNIVQNLRKPRQIER